MGVRVREKVKGSGEWWLFISHQGKRKAKRIGKDKKLARKIAKKIDAKLILGDLNIDEVNKKYPTFQEYAEMWVTLPNDLKESTMENYVSKLQLHIYPAIGKMKINEIRRGDLKMFFDSLLIKGINPKYVKVPIQNIFNHAIEGEAIEINPLAGIKPEKSKPQATVNPLKDNEVPLLLDEMKQLMNGKYYPATLCLVRTGVRFGELTALSWADVDFENRLILVDKSRDKKNRVTTTKNNKGRKVDVTPQLVETLRELKAKQWQEYAKTGEPMPDRIFNFSHTAYRKALKKCLKAAGLDYMRIHDLRHTYATVRLLRGHNISDVAFQLGHKNVSITYKYYVHWIPGTFRNQVDELDMQPNDTHVQPEKKAEANI
ncbi:MAG: tyrosine-type recombinase/integrase [Candidatus Desulfatibia sp.]|uniref:tyrosine-type recombinase/integrase n=1 Tax=Candidatus Desulfatibia sp. TaxID=3101189 RepID=UPI002F328237